MYIKLQRELSATEVVAFCSITEKWSARTQVFKPTLNKQPVGDQVGTNTSVKP